MELEVGESEEWLPLTENLGVWKDGETLPEQKVKLWALVLEARDIPYRAEQGDEGWQLLVPAGYLIAARNELRLFEKENRGWPPRLQGRPVVENGLANLSVLVLLATFHNITRLDITLFHRLVNWQAIGAADAEKILGGQWWRLATALTLHADAGHLAANLAIGGIFVMLLCRELGSGLAWCLILLSGILGNLANALLQQPPHSSIGASTAVFGTVGILAAINMLHHRKVLQKRMILPFAAAVALLAILGTEGKNTDLGAHLYGFVAGTLLGLGAHSLLEKHIPPSRAANALLAIVAASGVLSAWGFALLRA